MPSFSPALLLDALTAQLPPVSRGALCVSFSGGLDSTVLLTALARASAGHAQLRVRAVHIDHQLHPDSGQWAEHCRRAAEALCIPFLARRVRVERDAPSGPEAAARFARYEALRQIIEPGEVLLLSLIHI